MTATPLPPAHAALSARRLSLLFVLALLVRAAFLFCGPWSDAERALMPDSRRYLLLADNLRTYHTFGKAEEDGQVHRAIVALRAANGTLPPPDANGLRPESFRTPGYPGFIAAVRSVVDDPRAVLAAQCLIGAFLPCLVAVIVAALGVAPRGAYLAGLLWALHPALILYDSLFLTESVFNAGAVVGLFLAARGRGLGGGLLLGLTALVRPLGLFYLPLAALLIGKRWRVLLVLVLAAALPSLAWAWRNQARGEGFRVSPVGDVNLLFYSAAYSISEERGEDWFRSWPARVDELANELGQRVAPQQDVYEAARALAVEKLKARPVAVARVHLKALVKLLVDHSAGDAAQALGVPYQPSGLFSRLVLRESGESGGFSGTLLVAAGWTLLNLAVLASAAAGAVRMLWRREWGLLVACGLTLLLFALATGSVGLERFRLPMMLPLLTLVAYAVAGPAQTAAKEVRP